MNKRATPPEAPAVTSSKPFEIVSGVTVTLDEKHQAYEDALMAAVTERVHMTIARLSAMDRDPDLYLPVDQVVARMMAAVPRVDRFSQEIGPFYTPGGLIDWLGISRQHLANLTKTNRIIALTTADGNKVYPSFQFTTRGKPLPVISDIMELIAEWVEPWTISMWFITENRDLEDWTPAEWARRRRGNEQLVDAARRWAEIFNGGTGEGN